LSLRARCLLFALTSPISCAILSFFFSCYGDPRDLHSFPTRRSSDLGRFGDSVIRQMLSLAATAGDVNVAIKRVTGLTTKQLSDQDRKSTRLNSSHVAISYAVFCLKKKKKGNVAHACIDIITRETHTP